MHGRARFAPPLLIIISFNVLHPLGAPRSFSLLSIGLIAFQKIVIAPKEAQWRGGK